MLREEQRGLGKWSRALWLESEELQLAAVAAHTRAREIQSEAAELRVILEDARKGREAAGAGMLAGRSAYESGLSPMPGGAAVAMLRWDERRPE